MHSYFADYNCPESSGSGSLQIQAISQSQNPQSPPFQNPSLAIRWATPFLDSKCKHSYFPAFPQAVRLTIHPSEECSPQWLKVPWLLEEIPWVIQGTLLTHLLVRSGGYISNDFKVIIETLSLKKNRFNLWLVSCFLTGIYQIVLLWWWNEWDGVMKVKRAIEMYYHCYSVISCLSPFKACSFGSHQVTWPCFLLQPHFAPPHPPLALCFSLTSLS